MRICHTPILTHFQGYDCDTGRCDVGSINLPGQFEKYEALVKDAVAKGAQIKLGGKIRANANGHFWEPTILVNVNHTMRIMREEIFGPIMCVVKVKSDEEVIKLSNDCEFGLGCSVFSSGIKFPAIFLNENLLHYFFTAEKIFLIVIAIFFVQNLSHYFLLKRNIFYIEFVTIFPSPGNIFLMRIFFSPTFFSDIFFSRLYSCSQAC